MDELLTKMSNQEDVGNTIQLCVDEIIRLGVKSGTYHIGAPHASQVGPNVFIAAFGFDEEWIRSYRKPQVRQHDPIPDYVMRVGSAMTYAEALEGLQLNEEQAAFMDSVRAAGYFDTMGIPAYGPYDFDSYVTISFGRPFSPEDEQVVDRVVALLEVCNRRIAQLLEGQNAAAIALSDREVAVLNWMGRAKSNGDIATILGIAPGTVDTYVRRLFSKLDTNNRVTAVIQGIRLGIIRF